MADDDFDPTTEDAREIARKIADEPDGFLSLMGHLYRGEMGRATTWRTRMDRTTNWAVVVLVSVLTWSFSDPTRPHYVLLAGLVVVNVFLFVEVRRYRVYDVYRSRVRILEEDVLANAIDPEGAVHSNWRDLLADDLRTPAKKVPYLEALARRLRRVYLALVALVVVAWVVRLGALTPPGVGLVAAAAIGDVPGGAVIGCVAGYVVAVTVIAFRPRRRRAMGGIDESDGNGWRDEE